MWVALRLRLLDLRILKKSEEGCYKDDEFIYFFDLLKIIDYRIPWLAFEIVKCTILLFFWQQPFWKQLYTNDPIDKEKKTLRYSDMKLYKHHFKSWAFITLRKKSCIVKSFVHKIGFHSQAKFWRKTLFNRRISHGQPFFGLNELKTLVK